MHVPRARVLAGDLAPHAEQTVRVAGWIHRRRRLSGVTFLVIRDRSGLVQVIVKDPATVEQVAALGEESVVDVVGQVTPSAQAPGGYEITDPRITALGDPAATPPVEL